VASRDAKTNSVAPKKVSTVQKLTPKPRNHRNKCPAHRHTILFQLLSKNIKVKSSVSPWRGKALNLASRFRLKEQKINYFFGKISLVLQLEKPEFLLLTLRLIHPTGYKQRKVILPEICLVRIAQQTTKIDMILKIKNQKSKIQNGITSRQFRFTPNWRYPQLFARFPICQKTPPAVRVHFQNQHFRTAYRVYVWPRG
jgi:hypothetical protein